MIRVNNKSQEEESEVIKINPAMKRHFELEIETLQNAPRDEGKLRELLKLKVSIALVYSIPANSTVEVVIQRMIEDIKE